MSDEVIIDPDLLDDAYSYTSEERLPLATDIANLDASLVFRDDDLSHVELQWSAASGLPFPARPEVVAAVLEKAKALGYQLSIFARRAVQLDEGQRCVERDLAIFDPEPSTGDGEHIHIVLRLGIDLDEDEFENLNEAKAVRDRWAARVVELVREKYPKAQLETEVFDADTDDAIVTAPAGIDPTDFEWEIDDLIDQATAEILES